MFGYHGLTSLLKVIGQTSCCWDLTFLGVVELASHSKVTNIDQRRRVAYIRPLFRNYVEKFVLEVALNDNRVVPGDGCSASELGAEELGRDLQVDAEGLQT